MRPTVLQILPKLDVGGVEQGTLEVAAELSRRKHRSIVVSESGRLVPRLIAEGSEHIDLPVGRKSLLSLRLIPTLQRLFQEQHIDIIHARSRLPAWLSYLAWKKLAPKQRPIFMTTVHGQYSVNRYSEIMTKGERVIAISDTIKDYILENYPRADASKITVIHRGINRENYPYLYTPPQEWLNAWNKKYPELADKFIVTLPGRVTRLKGHGDFIRMIHGAYKNGLHHIHGLIAGGVAPRKERYLKELKQSVQALQLENQITFLGHSDNMRDIMALSDIVVSLSNPPEAFGRTTLEALCLGVPVIGYDHGGTAEILSALFPEGKIAPLDINGAVARICQFYQEKPKVQDRNIFKLNDMLDKTLAVYNSFY